MSRAPGRPLLRADGPPRASRPRAVGLTLQHPGHRTPRRVSRDARFAPNSRRRRNFSHVRPLEDPVTVTTAPIHRLLRAVLIGLAALAAVVLLAPAGAHAATASAGVV